MTRTLINGEEIETISIFDRGLHYGDGLFETMAAHNGNIHLWETHWERLSSGCDRLKISLPDKETIEEEIALLCKNESQRVIKLIVTRGEGQRGYRFSDKQQVTRILISYPHTEYPDSYQNEGIAVRYCETTLSENSQLAGIKHLNRLEQVLARNEWDTDEYQEGLMLNQQGHVIDGTMSNIFVVKDNRLFTPDLSLCGVSGVMRKTIVKFAKELGLEVYEKIFTTSELEMADEIFLSNSIFGIWPVKVIGKTRFTKVGAHTKQLQVKLKEELKLE